MIKTIFDRKVLDAGSMIDYVYIQEESLGGSMIGTMNSTPIFITKWSGMGKFEVISPTTRIEGVAIPSGATHVFYMPWSNIVYELDGTKLFIKRPVKLINNKERYYKLDSKTNYGEQDKYILIFCHETGMDGNEGANL